ncbi:SCO1664 family protein [Mycolicibacterium fallax]|jgi:uncharacterized repeat protein (TIGR03843 family)|uniref:Phosphatidylinositol kinase n=1 Tax=Mycolicibacterium fallax TaxID=1793 RepID=A0A1X1R4Z5_MYCFA|nr:SCO1664 family protein [Mycolicibacterium fallax]ORU99343.1 phosphatidylinositol kinase [Mycolicibacterium fallax]BBY97735.1 phosphatidylinositol kinase [Mycolicibacterium fallax]
MTSPAEAARILRHGALTILGRIRSASNATFLCEARLGDGPDGGGAGGGGAGGAVLHCVYKPIAGEQPLWDFPDGTLAGRERASFLISDRLGWNLVPDTVIRDGPAGPGMVQRWVNQPGDGLAGSPQPPEDAEVAPDLVDICPVDAVPDGYLPVLRAQDYDGNEVALVHADDRRLRRLAVFDVLVNNADRKGGHVLAGTDGRVYGVDHGLCLHAQDKLRTVLWGWAGQPIGGETLCDITKLLAALDGEFGAELAEHLTDAELAALGDRARGLLADPALPGPDQRARPIPWPAF